MEKLDLDGRGRGVEGDQGKRSQILVKELATKPDNLSQIPQGDRRMLSSADHPSLHMHAVSRHAGMQTQKHKVNKCKKIKKRKKVQKSLEHMGTMEIFLNRTLMSYALRSVFNK